MGVVKWYNNGLQKYWVGVDLINMNIPENAGKYKHYVLKTYKNNRNVRKHVPNNLNFISLL